MYSFLADYCTKKFQDIIENERILLCDEFSMVDISMPNKTDCEISLLKELFSITYRPGLPSTRLLITFTCGPTVLIRTAAFMERAINGKKDVKVSEGKFEVPYNSTEESLFQLSTLHELYGLTEDDVLVMNKIRDLYVRFP